VAVTTRVQDRDGTWRDGEASFHRFNVWRDQAVNLTDFLSKGDRVMVTLEGRVPGPRHSAGLS
jgi:single-stranded DNA-binding protein